uniref:Putative homing endonuclease n=1 Tax=viral metagenome TaxID=1070528 RepID=A0A6M3MC36_9ZZZZ
MDNLTEQWKSIPAYEGYEASNLGQIGSRKSPKSGSYSRRILSSCKNGSGYLVVALIKNGKSRSFLVHRLIAMSFLGLPSKENDIIHHKDGNSINNRLDNLEWSNRSKNALDSPNMKGEKSSRAKLKNGEVWLIRKLYAKGIKQIIISKMFKTDPSRINKIIHYVDWKKHGFYQD